MGSGDWLTASLPSGTAEYNPEKPSETNFCVEWLCSQERLNPEVANILGVAARYRRATVGSSHDDAHPDN